MPDRSSDRSTYLPLKNKNGNGISYKNSNDNYTYSLPVVDRSANEAEEDSIDIRQLASIVKHRIRLICAVAIGVTTATAIFTFSQEPIYKGSFKLLVESVTEGKDSPLAVLESSSGGLDYETQIEVLQSPRVLNPIIKTLSRKYPDIEYDKLIKAKKSPLEITQLDETKILEISYVDTDPQKIEFVIDNLAEAYLRYSLEETRLEVQQGLDFVESQLPEVRERVDELEGEVQKFRQKYNLLDPAEQAEIIVQQQVDYEQKYFDTLAELKETRSLYALLQQQLDLEPQQALAASYLSESPRYQNLLDELQQVEVELAKESTRFSSENPVVQTLEEKRAKLVALLQQEAGSFLGKNLNGMVENNPNLTSPSTLRLELNQQYIEAANQIQILELREQTLKEAVAKINSSVKQMPVLARQYADLNRQLNVATESLNRFLTAQEELQLQGAQQALPWQAISQPKVTENPIAPNPPRNLALGLITRRVWAVLLHY